MIVRMQVLRLLLMLLCVTAAQAQGIRPPEAERRPHEVKSPHGNRQDEYFWLRDDGAPAKRWWIWNWTDTRLVG
jgi:hypothetical protein